MVINKLEWATRALAQTAEKQLELFPDFVNTADELALIWEEALENLHSLKCKVSAEQMAAISILDNYIISLSGEKNADFWTEDALRNSAQWDEIRNLAVVAAEKMHWSIGFPGKSEDVYIGGPKE